MKLFLSLLLLFCLPFLGVLLHVFPPLLLDLPSFPYPLDEHEAIPMARLAALLSICKLTQIQVRLFPSSFPSCLITQLDL